jgi:hypothetical protein
MKWERAVSRNLILDSWLCRAAGLLLGTSISLSAWAGDTSVTVGNGSVTVTGAGTVMNFPVTRTGDLSYDAYLSFQTQTGQNDMAIAGTDYSPLQGSWLLPAGVANLTIPVAINGSNATSADKTFSLNLLSIAAQGPRFALASPQTFGVGPDPFLVAVADINGDGKPDLIVADYDNGQVGVLINTTPPGASTPTFTDQQLFTTGGTTFAVAVADINGDGKPDIVASDDQDGKIFVLLNTTPSGATTASFTNAKPSGFRLQSGAASIAVADLNGDGKPDLVVGGDNNAVTVLINNTATNSSTVSLLPQSLDVGANESSTYVALADLNGDGIPDLIVTDSILNTVSVLLNSTVVGSQSPSFATTPWVQTTGIGPLMCAAVDVNGDGIPDLISQDPVNDISVLINTTPVGATNPSFGGQQFFPVAGSPLSVTAADVDGDGRSDLIVAYSDPNIVGISVLLNTAEPGAAAANFAQQQLFITDEGSYFVATGDINGDGLQDIITGNGDNAAVFLNTTTPGGGPAADLAPASLDFGNQNVGTTSAVQTVTLTNNGNQPLSVTSIVASAQYAETNTCGSSVAAGANCTISVTFTPTAVGAQTGSITLTDGATGSLQTISLSGTGVVQAIASLSSTSLAFGNQNVGSTSAAQTVTLTNSGNLALNVSFTPSAQFAETDNCNGSVAAGANCTISVTFIPTASGNQTGGITLTDNAADNPQTIALSGTGLQAVAGLSQTSLTFTSQDVGSTSTAQTVTLTNSGNTVLSITSMVASAQYAETDNCNGSVAAGANCTISVTFTPTAGGSQNGSITLTDNAAVGSQTISLSGIGLGAVATLSPTSLTFVGQNVGTTSTAQTVTLTNGGNIALSITSIVASAQYAEADNCNGSVAAGANCTVSVTFTPIADGNQPGTVTITDNAGSQTIGLSGTGAQPNVSLVPATLAFDNQNVGTTSAAQTVTLTNTGSGPLTVTSTQVSTSYAENDTCVAASPIVANGTCIITVTFTPTTTGNQPGSATITDNAGSQAISLSGAGTDVAATANAGNLNATIDAAVNGNLSATLGYSGQTLTFAVATAPTHGSVTITNAATGAFTYTPTAGYVGSDSFTFNATDAYALASNTATESVMIAGPIASLSPSSFTYPNTAAGGSSSGEVFTLSNSGNAALAITTISKAGPNPNQFGITANTCGASLAAGTSCTITLVFDPTAPNPYSSGVIVVDSDPSGQQESTVSGTGTVVSPTLTPTSFTFAGVTAGGAGAVKNFTLKNTNLVTLTGIVESKGSPNPNQFTITTSTTGTPCGSSLAAGASCTIGMVFDPSGVASYSSKMAVDTAQTPIVESIVSGTGLSAIPSLTPTTGLNFGQLSRGQSQTLNATLTNSGTGTLSITSISTSGIFSVSGGACGSTLASGAHCTITVKFQPTGNSTFGGNLKVVDNPTSGSGTQSIPLTGEGTGF